jgi:hypothetical protein
MLRLLKYKKISSKIKYENVFGEFKNINILLLFLKKIL